jgi:hypothetical protein
MQLHLQCLHTHTAPTFSDMTLVDNNNNIDLLCSTKRDYSMERRELAKPASYFTSTKPTLVVPTTEPDHQPVGVRYPGDGGEKESLTLAI